VSAVTLTGPFAGARRIVCHFSCGAASAVATMLAIRLNNDFAEPLPLVVRYCHVREEHPDNMRFLRQCEQWFGVPIGIVMNEKYDGSVVNVIRMRRYVSGKDGAPCTKHLKKDLRLAFAEPGDLNVFGFTAEEQDRHDRMIDADNTIRLLSPLIEYGMDKGACLALVERQGIELPMMYRMGYDHNNCIGCVKAGAWYWNKIRVDFPERFEQQQQQLEEEVGHPTLRINGENVWLRDLAPGRGRKHEEPKIECGVACELLEYEMRRENHAEMRRLNRDHRELADAMRDEDDAP
jgi:hypothetical protein